MDIQDHVEDMAKELAGNWLMFESFRWYNKPLDANQCARIHLRYRDSCLIEESNAATIIKALEKYLGDLSESDAELQKVDCWAYGWRDELVIRVYKNGDITDAFKEYAKFALSLAEYPVLDESDLSAREYKAACNAIEYRGKNIIKEGCPDTWVSDVWHWLCENDPESLNDNALGPFPSEESVKAALITLGFAKTEEDDMIENIRVYDNGGASLDRYSVVLDAGFFGGESNGNVAILGLDKGGKHFSQFSEGKEGKHLGTRIEFKDLDEATQTHIKQRLIEE